MMKSKALAFGFVAAVSASCGGDAAKDPVKELKSSCGKDAQTVDLAARRK